jgi:hypothetical protein
VTPAGGKIAALFWMNCQPRFLPVTGCLFSWTIVWRRWQRKDVPVVPSIELRLGSRFIQRAVVSARPANVCVRRHHPTSPTRFCRCHTNEI